MDNPDSEATIKELKLRVRELERAVADVQAERQAATALRDRNEEFVRLLVEQVGAILWTVDTDLRFTWSTGAGLEKLGAMPDELVGLEMMAYLGIDDENDAALLAVRSALGGGIESYHYYFAEYVWETHVAPLRSHEGEIIGAVALSLDVTERIAADRALAESQERLRRRNRFIETILDNLPIGFGVTDTRDNSTLYANKAFEEIYGWPPETFATVESFFEHVYPDPEYRKEISERIIADMASGDPDRMDWRNVRITTQSGEERYVHGKNIPLFEQNMMISTVQDVTAEKKLDDERKNLERRLYLSQRMEAIGRLAGGIAHDFNNYLTPILGYSEIMMDDPGRAAEDIEMLEQIVKAGENARNLVRQLLAFGRRQKLAFEYVRVDDIVNGIEKLLRRTLREDIEIVITCSAPDCGIHADLGQIEQVIMNLSINAADAMPEGGRLTIETSALRVSEANIQRLSTVPPGHYAVLVFTDTGCGINEETQAHMFEPFYSTKGDHGTGLGLATVYGVVKQHEGHILVSSKPGVGSTFSVFLPVADDIVDTSRSEALRAIVRTGSETVLLSEDNEQVRALTYTILQRNGYSVHTAGNGARAIEIAESLDSLDLLLTDVVMPDMSGNELYGRISDRFPKLRVIYMSGYTGNVVAHRGVVEENEDFVEKPFSTANLLEKIRTVLDR